MLPKQKKLNDLFEVVYEKKEKSVHRNGLFLNETFVILQLVDKLLRMKILSSLDDLFISSIGYEI